MTLTFLCAISGAGFSSKNKYMFGKVTVQIKLVEGDSAGTVTAFYVSFLLCSAVVVILFLFLAPITILKHKQTVTIFHCAEEVEKLKD